MIPAVKYLKAALKNVAFLFFNPAVSSTVKPVRFMKGIKIKSFTATNVFLNCTA
jgi:hypothetical protein